MPQSGGLTVTLKLHEACAPLSSVAVQLTFVVPVGKAEPDGIEQVRFTLEALPLTVGGSNLTTALLSPGLAVTTTISFGQLITGGGSGFDTITFTA